MGGGPPLAAAGSPTAPPNQPAAVPPFQPSASLTSNAALAGTTAPAFDPSHDLRINSQASNPDPYSGRYGPGAPGGFASPPQPTFQPAAAPHDSLLTQVFGPSSLSRAGTYEQLKTQLASRGVTYQRLETWDNGWKFTCSVPSRQNAFISRTYEAQARDDLSAMRAVIDQIDKAK